MGEQTSEEIDIEYKLIRLVHKRKKAVRTCKCTHSPLTKIAPAPPKLVKGGMLTTDFWAVDRCLKARVSSGKGFSYIQSISIEAVVLARSI